MKKCPCSECLQQGCGQFHDVCHDYKKWCNELKADKNDVNKKFSINRQWEKLGKTTHKYREKYKTGG